MPKLRRFLSLLALALLLGVVALPHHAFAQAANLPTAGQDDCADGSVDNVFKSHSGAVAQAKIQATSALINAFGAVDVKAQTCFNQLVSMFQALGSLTSPFNIFWAAVLAIVMQVVNQVCTAALNIAGQVKTFVQSQLSSLFCLPLPQLGLNISGMLNLPNAPPCTGVSLYSPNPLGNRPVFSFQTLFPTGTGH